MNLITPLFCYLLKQKLLANIYNLASQFLINIKEKRYFTALSMPKENILPK